MVTIISAFSAKGGNGTSTFLLNTAIYMAQKGKKILLIDAAQNGGTLHSYMGLPESAVLFDIPPHFTVLPLISTDYHNLSFFSNLRASEQESEIPVYLYKWREELNQSNFDYIFIDLGSVVDSNILKAMEYFDFNIIITGTDRVAIEKTNYFINTLFSYRFNFMKNKTNLKHTVEEIKRKKNALLFNPRNILTIMFEKEPDFEKEYKKVINDISMGIVYNKVLKESEKELRDFYPFIIRNAFGFDIDVLGELPYSGMLATSSKKLMTAGNKDKNSEFLQKLDHIVSKLPSVISKKQEKEKTLEIASPLKYYEILGLERGSSRHDIKVRYEKLKDIYSEDNSMVKSLYTSEQIFLYRSLIEKVYEELIEDTNRKEYDMNIAEKLNSLSESLPESFKPSNELKKFFASESDEHIEKKDVFGRRSLGMDEKGVDVEKSRLIEILNDVDKNSIDGNVLRNLRKKLNFTLDNISFRTKISNFMIKAIEENNRQNLPADIYVRGFIKNYCEALKIGKKDTGIIVDKYMKNLKEK